MVQSPCKVTKVNRALQITVTCVALLVVLPGASFGGLITQVGTLNIIVDAGNPSNGTPLSRLDVQHWPHPGGRVGQGSGDLLERPFGHA